MRKRGLTFSLMSKGPVGFQPENKSRFGREKALCFQTGVCWLPTLDTFRTFATPLAM